jgi:hypothetical protein
MSTKQDEQQSETEYAFHGIGMRAV